MTLRKQLSVLQVTNEVVVIEGEVEIYRGSSKSAKEHFRKAENKHYLSSYVPKVLVEKNGDCRITLKSYVSK